ncbi:metallophosphoesterase family protein [Cereibacter sphaeroides]|uniref:metallophosphoesterase family protein n=1 Tax=Cereibacter sphaeroides TaxID=1063 RepID=UPI001F21A391|nr:metallophosphoesterase family protein [Cereibacter sphaeroides]MCE6969439.1 metallophosphoesterase [Cereibacter sphaeroides]
MRRVLHLSDLHFGRDRPELMRPLIETVNSLEPDLVAISGDLTQRATEAQFRAAATFVAALKPPVLVVPGNHDVPLHNLAVRLVKPWQRYRRWFGRDLEPCWIDDEMIVVGANTVNPLAWQRGWFRPRSLARIRRSFAGETERVRIVVVHHPMEHTPEDDKELMHGAGRAIEDLAGCGADVVLSGHLHTWRVGPFAEAAGRGVVLQVHAGTGLSTRVRGEPNDFNLLEVSSARIRVQRYVACEDASGFRITDSRAFHGGGGRWSVEP